jgi:hypothetical protein
MGQRLAQYWHLDAELPDYHDRLLHKVSGLIRPMSNHQQWVKNRQPGLLEF